MNGTSAATSVFTSTRTGLVYHEDYLKHDTGNHPERGERLKTIMMKLKEAGFMEKIEQIRPVKASVEQIQYVHQREYVKGVKAVCERGGGMLDLDTPVCRDSYEVALLSAGGAIKAVDEVMTSLIKNAFALIRPPGHHATPNRGMGFCIFNNIAIAAEHLKRKYNVKRILIADWDVHHGNGTQEMFFDDPSVLYFSTHQYPHYPGSGWIDEMGRGDGEGFTVNVPLPTGVDTDGYLYVMEKVLLPIAMDFRPEFVLVSVGFDIHAADPLAGMQVTSNGFGLLTEVIKDIAEKDSEGRIVMVLEGGYNLNAIGESALSIFNSLLGDKDKERERRKQVEEKKISQVVKKRVARVKEVQSRYWKNFP